MSAVKHFVNADEWDDFRAWVDTDPWIPAGKSYYEVWHENNHENDGKEKTLDEWIRK